MNERKGEQYDRRYTIRKPREGHLGAEKISERDSA